jgi:hypothetical protein
MCVMICTRLDISHSINKLGRFANNTSMNNWKVIKRVLKYLRHALGYELHYMGYSAVLERA